MPIQNIQRFLVLLALGVACQFGLAQQGAKIIDMPETVSIGLDQELAEDVNWGEITPGTMVRCRVSVKNTTESPVEFIRIISEPGAFTSGVKVPLREVTLQPGESVDFFIFTSVQVPGDYSFKNELIVDIDGKRQRRGVFQYQGSVVPSNGDF